MPTAAEESAFLTPIRAAERDDGPRLIYADFLADSDDPADRRRADFVRLQLALARLPDNHPRRHELKHRADDLLHRDSGLDPRKTPPTSLTIWSQSPTAW